MICHLETQTFTLTFSDVVRFYLNCMIFVSKIVLFKLKKLAGNMYSLKLVMMYPKCLFEQTRHAFLFFCVSDL